MIRTTTAIGGVALALAGLLFACATATSQPPVKAATNARVDRLFQRWAKVTSPGMSVAVARNGELLFSKGYGSAQLEFEAPIGPKTVFHAASVSKQFTAFAIALLANQGKLSLDDDIRRHVAEVPDFGRTITLRHLLHHTSGLRDQWELIAMAGGRLDDVITKDRILRLVARQRELNFPPGREYVYCNTGYTLLAEVIARVTKRPFAEWMGDNVFKPIGMKRTHFHTNHERIVKGRAYSYARRAGGGFRKRVLSYANAGATSLFTTAEDLVRWSHNLLSGEVGGPTVAKQMRERGRLTNGKRLPYALGLVHGRAHGRATLGHGGSDAGFRAALLVFPEHGLSVAVLSNFANTNPSALASRVAGFYLEGVPRPKAANAPGPESDPPRPPRPVKIDPAVLDDYIGSFELRVGWVITIRRKGDALTSKATGERRFPMVPIDADRFHVPAYRSDIEFVRNTDGKVTHFRYRDMTARRVEKSAPNATQLAALAGEYDSPELDTTYTIRVSGERIAAEHLRHGIIPLRPWLTDEFRGSRWYFRFVAFERDAGGEVTGFRLTGGRVRGLWFQRKNN